MKPIPFNADMVRAILEGRKTVTRRVVKLKYSNTHLEMFTNKYGTRLIEKQNEEPGVTTIKNPDGTTTHTLLACIEKAPPCRPGDILYVRETWCKTDCFGLQDGYIYKANDNSILEHTGFTPKWHPSIHMPREAARIFLRVTDVRVERLQDITEKDMQQEGVITRPLLNDFEKFISQKSFALLWDSTIKPADRALYDWEANPWVWVIEFERCERPGAAS